VYAASCLELYAAGLKTSFQILPLCARRNQRPHLPLGVLSQTIESCIDENMILSRHDEEAGGIRSPCKGSSLVHNPLRRNQSDAVGCLQCHQILRCRRPRASVGCDRRCRCGPGTHGVAMSIALVVYVYRFRGQRVGRSNARRA
jgi:hypothetical protein